MDIEKVIKTVGLQSLFEWKLPLWDQEDMESIAQFIDTFDFATLISLPNIRTNQIPILISNLFCLLFEKSASEGTDRSSLVDEIGTLGNAYRVIRGEDNDLLNLLLIRLKKALDMGILTQTQYARFAKLISYVKES